MADFKYGEVLKHADRLSRAPVEQQAKLSALAARTAKNIGNRARTLAPVLTGTLRSSITVEETSPLHWEIKADAFYGRFVEYGTSRQAPQPFMAPAAEAYEEAFYLGVEVIAAGLLD